MIPSSSPYCLTNSAAYDAWRATKLADCPARMADLMVEIENPANLDDREIAAIRSACGRWNMAFYCCNPEAWVDKDAIKRFAATFGLCDIDDNLCADGEGVSSIEIRSDGLQGGYIPYSNRPLNWHTDGYYYVGDRLIRGILMHCVRAAVDGGDNVYLDPEIAYIRLRDENPDWIRAMMQDDALLIPANEGSVAEKRAAVAGPVFSIDPVSGALHMRYTARTRSIAWKDDSMLTEARQALLEVLDSDDPFVFRYHLQPGEGIICNNVLHCRTGFTDDAANGGRLLYRARYRNRVGGIGAQRERNDVVA